MTREKLIQLIHIGTSELAMDEATYRQMLAGLCGKTSARDRDLRQLNRVLDGLKRRGFRVSSAGKGERTTRPLADYPQAKKLRMLWLDMHSSGIVRDSSEAALSRWLKRETGVDRIEWLLPQQAGSAIEKLKQWRRRSLAARQAHQYHREGGL